MLLANRAMWHIKYTCKLFSYLHDRTLLFQGLYKNMRASYFLFLPCCLIVKAKVIQPGDTPTFLGNRLATTMALLRMPVSEGRENVGCFGSL